MLIAAACGASGDKAYPMGLNGTEVNVGESMVSVLYDAGFTIEALNWETHIGTIPEAATDELEKNSYYPSIKVRINYENGAVSGLEMECNYDVDYSA